MECSVCGRNATLVRARIEGTVLRVCPECARLGEFVPEAEAPQKKQQRLLEISEINPDFSSMIKIARERNNLTHENLARKINEKMNIIERVEHGMKPTKELSKKLEKALSIKLLDFSEEPVDIKKKHSSELTLGDVAEMKIKKRK